MRCWNVGNGQLLAVGASNVDEQTRDLLELTVCQENGGEVWSGAGRARGYAALVIATELEMFGLNVVDSIMTTADMVT